MKRKKLVIIGIIAAVLVNLFLLVTVYCLFDAQYNMKTGISSIMNITIDEEQEKIKIGNLEGYHIFVEGLKVNECYFTTIDATTISLVDAVNEGKISVKDMARKAFEKKDTDDKTIYYYENYLIEITGKEVLIKNK
ncbi:MAG: hypothetical protein E7548_00395 [Ruminococcaceae bacterium]|nr:hypothetical protein [Oscillospiraceae bacterium]